MRSEKAIRHIMCHAVSAIVALTAVFPALAVKVNDSEIDRAHKWAKARFSDKPSADLPFSFTYDSKPSGEVLKTWKVERSTHKLDGGKKQRVAVYSSPNGLKLTCREVEYKDFPHVEWTLYFKNEGQADTPIIADIKALDTVFSRPAGGEFVLHTNKGDAATQDSYQPITLEMPPQFKKELASAGGRPTTGAFPYWNIATGNSGFIATVGWPGQWSASFERDADTGLHIRAGQELTHFVLHPGEKVRSPLAVVQFYDGPWIRGQNVWRKWMLAHNVPRPGGKLPQPFNSICMGLQQSEETETKAIDSYVNNGVKHDYWWMDAGWYPCKDIQWQYTGTWEPDPARFPRGIKAVSDYAHSKGIKLVLWFEPERCAGGTWITEKHPEWVLGGAGGGLVNLGNPEALKWVIEHFDGLIVSQGVDLYREDFNIDPLGYWRGNDTPDRQGITENFYVQGHLAYWDELRRRHPDMLIDSCASGGRRNDLESLRRAVPLLRSDFHAPGEPNHPEIAIGDQGHTYGLAMWVPYYGDGDYYNDGYSFRSQMCPALGMGYNPKISPIDWDALKKTIAMWRAIAFEFYGDFYPLTEYSLADNVWMAWQFDRPEAGQGMVQVFRHKDAPDETINLKLNALEPKATYTITDLDAGTSIKMTGKELRENGLPASMQGKPGALVFSYKKAQ